MTQLSQFEMLDFYKGPEKLIGKITGLIDALAVHGGVELPNVFLDPEAYSLAIRGLSSRHVDADGIQLDTPRTRQEQQSGDAVTTDQTFSELVESTAESIGAGNVEGYGFSTWHYVNSEVTYVTSGAPSAIRDRSLFALTGVSPVVIAANPVPAPSKAVEAIGFNPAEIITEGDVAHSVVAEVGSDRLSAFDTPEDTRNNFDAIMAYAETHPNDDRLSVVTSDLYVAAVIADCGAVATKLGLEGEKMFRVYALAPDPVKFEARTLDTYRDEIIRAGRSAAGWITIRKAAQA